MRPAAAAPKLRGLVPVRPGHRPGDGLRL